MRYDVSLSAFTVFYFSTKKSKRGHATHVARQGMDTKNGTVFASILLQTEFVLLDVDLAVVFLPITVFFVVNQFHLASPQWRSADVSDFSLLSLDHYPHPA